MVPTIFYAACAIAAAGLALLLMQSGSKFRMGATILGLAGIAWILVIVVQTIPTPASEIGPLGLMILCAFVSVASAVRVITHHRPVFCALYFVLVVVSGAAIYVLLSAEFVAFSLVIVYAGAILITYLFVLMLAQQSPADIGAADAVDYDRIAREPAGAVIAGFVLIAVLGGSVFSVSEQKAESILDQNRAIRQGWGDLSMMPKLLLEQARRTDSTVTAVIARKDGQMIAVQTDHSAIISVQRADQMTPSDLTLAPSLLPDNTSRVGMALVTRFPVSLELAGIILLMAMFGAVVLARKQTDIADDDRRALAGLGKVMDGSQSIQGKAIR
ncbi:MAG: NADH-quinone oxidoreductase subunit J [Planctomycetota bacterium]|nr:hypothetical protein [Planctomycetota bacterium]